MAKEKILVVDDERDIVDLISYNLEREGFKVIPAYNGEHALELAEKEFPNLIVLDLMLPGISGLDICRVLRNKSETSRIPIIILSAKATEPDIVVGLELGADDYITKPFSHRELVARVNAVLRRASRVEDSKERLSIGNLVIDPANYQATWKGNPIELTSTEFNLLLFLVQRPGRVLTRQQILDGVLGDDAFVTERTVDVHIRRLRKKLEEASPYIVTRRGIGYMFQENAYEGDL
jgi:phosphate regulon transcriptional regulator PhoB